MRFVWNLKSGAVKLLNASTFLFVLLASPLIFLSCNKESGTSKENTVVIWHWMTDREEAFLELARRYKEKTGVTVDFQLYAPTENYAQKVRVGAQTKSLPEIFGVLGGKRDFATFIEAGHIENLNSQLGRKKGSWKETFYEEALNSCYFESGNSFQVPEGYYGIPLDIMTIPMIYNKRLFKKAGLDPNAPPATWAEFLDAGKKLRASGVTGFVSGWREVWLIYSIVTDMAHNLMGEKKVMDTIRGKVPYTDGDWITVLEAFHQLHKAGFSDPGLVTMGNNTAEQAFAGERSGISFNGAWAVNVFAKMNPRLDYGVFRIPALGNKFPRTVWGGAGTILHVNGKSPNKELAVDFMRWITEKSQMGYLSTTTKNLPAVKDVGGDMPKILKDFASVMENSIHPNRFQATEEPKVIEVLTKGIQSILIGEKTATQIAAEVQEMKERAGRI